MRAVAGIGPGAVGVDREVAIGAVRVGLHHHMRLARVRVGDRQRARRIQRRGRIALGHRFRVRRHRRQIVGPGDRHRHRAVAGAVGRRHRQRVRRVLPGGQGIRLGLIERIGPLAGIYIEGEGTVGAHQRGRCDRGKMVLPGIDVGDFQLAMGAWVAGCRRPRFDHRDIGRSEHRDRRRIIHAGNLDARGSPAQRAVGHANGIGKRIRERLARAQVQKLLLERCGKGGGVVPDLAVAGDPDLCAVGAPVGGSCFGAAQILRQQVGWRVSAFRGGRGAGAVVERPKRLRIARPVIGHHVQVSDAETGLRQPRGRENIVARLRSVAKGSLDAGIRARE